MSNIPLLPGVASEVAQVAARLRQSMVLVRGRWNGAGSGVVWRDGIILSNDHVVRGDEARVSLWDGRQVDGRVIGRDKTLDLAALRVNAPGAPPAPLGPSRGLRIGQLVIAVGNPLGVEGATTLGIISTLGRTAPGGRDLVEADIDVYPGNSGGPLADVQGRVIGLTSMILTPGIALAVPAHVADTALARWLGETRPLREGLGIKGWAIPLPTPWAQQVGQPSGVMLGEIMPRSQAEQAGLLVGDILIGLDEERVLDGEALQRFLNGGYEPSQVRVLRAGEVQVLPFTPGIQV